MMKKLVQMKCPLYGILFIVYAITLWGCASKSYDSPPGYDFRKPDLRKLGKSLNEISGITYNSEDGSLWAISDSKRKIVGIRVKSGKLKDETGNVVAQDQDLEDIVKLDTATYLLSSSGLLYEVPLKTRDSASVRSYPFWSTDKNDFETIYYDPSADGLIIVCKTCEDDKGKHVRSAYRFDLKTKKFDSSAFYTISTEEVRKILKNDDAEFDPSAAAIHPINKRLYILSSAGNLLVIADNRGKVIEAYNLNPDEHPQAEGIAFAPNGDMYIANEGKYGTPTLQIFKYRNGVNK
jgi:uncharacterized protein YjiK